MKLDDISKRTGMPKRTLSQELKKMKEESIREGEIINDGTLYR